MKFLVSIIVLISIVALVIGNEYRYDRYNGKIVDQEVFRRGQNNTNCTIVVRHCQPHEGSRVDGTCNNYKFSTRGSARGPYLRLLNPDYANDKQDIRKDRNGNDLPSARRVRTTLQSDGRVVDKHDFTVAAYHYLEFIHRDVSLLNGPRDYLVYRQYCCQPQGQLDRRCKPIPVPNDDPYLRVTDIRCLNFSRAETFQDNGCINETISPEQINFQTPVIDLSTIYGVDERGLDTVRVYKHGLLKLEYRDFRHVPLVNLTGNPVDPVTGLAMSTPQLLGSLTTLQQLLGNSAMLSQIQNIGYLPSLSQLQGLGNQTILGQIKGLGNLTLLRQIPGLGNIVMLNPTMVSNNKMKGNSTLIKSRRRRQVTVPVSLPSTGGLNDAVLSPVMEAIDEVTPILMRIINTTLRNDTICLQNMNNESRCYAFGFPEAGNFDLRTTSFSIFFMREHNRLARALHELNPCWKDDRLFKVARQINIATASNIFMYELLPSILGFKNMKQYGLISEHVQHVTTYDEDAVPLVYAEFEIAIRYYHTLLDGRIKLYDEKYHYDREFSVSNSTYRQHLLELNTNFEEINRGTFYQPAAKADDIQDPEISEKFYGDLQRAADLPAIDIQRGRDLGLRGYNDYRHICGMKPANKFEDFADVMDHEKIESLKKLYVEIEDIDLLAGIMSENFIHGTFAGPTLFCIMTKQLQLFRFADRFWFERGDQFHSLTIPQLYEVRKTNIARLACDNVDAIKAIQPRAFENVGPHNKHVPCTHIPGLDIKKWEDISCRNDKFYHSDHDTQQHNNYNDEYRNKLPVSKDTKSEGKSNRYISREGKGEVKGHWFMNQNGKGDIEENWPFRINNKNKHWTLAEDSYSQYRPEKHEPINEANNGKYRPVSILNTDDGKYHDETDWPQGRSSKKQSQWANREGVNIRYNTHDYNKQPFTSVSHQYYQSDGGDFSPYFQKLFSTS